MSVSAPRRWWIAGLVALGLVMLAGGGALLLRSPGPRPDDAALPRPAGSEPVPVAASPVAPAPPATTPTAGGVHGVVLQPDGSPLEGAEVLVFDSAAAGPTFACAESDEKEPVFSAGCPEAVDALFAAADSGALDSVPRAVAKADKAGTFSFDLAGGPFDLLVLQDGAFATALDVEAGGEAVELLLAPGADVAGTVTNGENPLPGAEVIAASLRPMRSVRTRTDPQGRFHFGSLAVSGEVGLAARARDLLPAASVFTTEDPVTLELLAPGRITGVVTSSSGPVLGAVVQLAGGQRTVSDSAGHFEFARVTCDPCELVAEAGDRFAKTDVALDENRRAFAELTLQLVGELKVTLIDRDTREPLAGELTLLSDGEMASDFGEADATGVHVFPHVPYGRYQLSATAELHAARQIPLVVGKGRTATLLVLDPEQLLSGEVRGADGRALAGAEVQLASAASEQTAETGTDGHFELHGLGPGEHHLRVSHPRHLSASVKTVLPQLAPLLVTLRAAATLTVEVVTPAGEPVEAALVNMVEDKHPQHRLTAASDSAGQATFESLAPGHYLARAHAQNFASSDQAAADLATGEQRLRLTLKAGASLSGRVLDQDGLPVSGARVVSIPERHGFDGMLSEATSDESGGFTLTGLEEGTYSLHATHDEYAPENAVHARAGPEPVVVRLQRLAAVSGRVVASGVPVPSFTLDSTPFEAGDGAFRVSLAPGHQSLELTGAFAPRRLEVELKAGQELQLGDVSVQPQLVLDGVVMRGAEPAANLTLSIVALNGIAAQQVDTAADGRFHVEGLGPGTYSVQGAGPSGIVKGVSVTLGAGPTPFFRLTAEAAGAIIGAVLDGEGEPVRHAQVVAQSDQKESSMTMSEADGAFRLEGLEPGRYHLTAMFAGVRSPELLVTVSPLGQAQATLRLPNAE